MSRPVPCPTCGAIAHVPMTEQDAELVGVLVDSMLSDPLTRRGLARWVASWIEARAERGGSYALAYLAPWHPLVQEEDGSGPYQVVGPVDKFVLRLLQGMHGAWRTVSR